MMKTVDQWLDEYGESHQNRTNKLIHWVCVPLIMFCILGLIWALSPIVASLFMLGCLVFYMRLSLKLAVAMAVQVAIMFFVISIIEPVLIPVSLSLFVVAWIFQFVGHHIEGKKPSFLKDLQFLLIGPLWVSAFLFRKMNISY